MHGKRKLNLKKKKKLFWQCIPWSAVLFASRYLFVLFHDSNLFKQIQILIWVDTIWIPWNFIFFRIKQPVFDCLISRFQFVQTLLFYLLQVLGLTVAWNTIEQTKVSLYYINIPVCWLEVLFRCKCLNTVSKWCAEPL